MRDQQTLKPHHPAIAGQISTHWFDKKGWGRRNFSRYALPRTILRYLEVGSWEGASLFWTLHNLKPAHAIAVDPYMADSKRSRENNQAIGDKVERLWREHFPQVKGGLMREPSEEALPRLLAEWGPRFDLVYIDGSHHGADVLFDATVGSRLVKPGGLLILDDFSAARRSNIQGLRYAADAFVRTQVDEFGLLTVNSQVVLQRRLERQNSPGQSAGVGGTILEPGEYDHPAPRTERVTVMPDLQEGTA